MQELILESTWRQLLVSFISLEVQKNKIGFWNSHDIP